MEYKLLRNSAISKQKKLSLFRAVRLTAKNKISIYEYSKNWILDRYLNEDFGNFESFFFVSAMLKL